MPTFLPFLGNTFLIGTQSTSILIDSLNVETQFAVLELEHPPSSGPPLHLHTKEDEAFFILTGSYKFTISEKELIVSGGETVFAPKGTPHSFISLGPDNGKMLIILTPGGGEAYFKEMSLIDPNDPEAINRYAQLNERFGIEILPR